MLKIMWKMILERKLEAASRRIEPRSIWSKALHANQINKMISANAGIDPWYSRLLARSNEKQLENPKQSHAKDRTEKPKVIGALASKRIVWLWKINKETHTRPGIEPVKGRLQALHNKALRFTQKP